MFCEDVGIQRLTICLIQTLGEEFSLLADTSLMVMTTVIQAYWDTRALLGQWSGGHTAAGQIEVLLVLIILVSEACDSKGLCKTQE